MLQKLNKSIVLNKPDAIIFDTDNTLYEYNPANKKAEEAVEMKVKNLLGISSDLFHSTYNKSKIEVKKQLGATASSHSRLLYFQKFLEILGYKAQLMTALDLEQTFWRTYLANSPLFPGVRELLFELRNKKIAIAIVTDLNSHIQMRKLTYFQLQETFDAFVTSEEVGADKPDPKNFYLVLNKLGMNVDNNIWMVGDNPRTDIIGGRSIGAVTFQRINNDDEIGDGEFMPDFTFTKFTDLQNLVIKTID
tara:strand:+ start:1996 stop:2742 length:747 start_codon:yes stop_codon:yes gene_type:complete